MHTGGIRFPFTSLQTENWLLQQAQRSAELCTHGLSEWQKSEVVQGGPWTSAAVVIINTKSEAAKASISSDTGL